MKIHNGQIVLRLALDLEKAMEVYVIDGATAIPLSRGVNVVGLAKFFIGQSLCCYWICTPISYNSFNGPQLNNFDDLKIEDIYLFLEIKWQFIDIDGKILK